MQDCATHPLRFGTTPLPLKAAFDGGLLWLAEADRELGVCEEAVGEHVPEWRGGRSIRRPLGALVRQRVHQIACGYEDQNDADSPRKDPLLKLVPGRPPETDEDLASQPTLSRLENAPGGRDCPRIARSVLELYVRERGKDGAPGRILLDLDAFEDDPAHGEREGSFYHGYHKTRMYHPLLWSSMGGRTSSSRSS